MSFENYLKTRFGTDFPQIWKSFFTPKCVGFFAFEEVETKLEKLGINFVRLFDFALPFYIAPAAEKSTLTRSELFDKGEIYIQNASSFLAANLLGVKAGESVLDMCASPGGKSVVLSRATNDLAVMEADRERFFVLKFNLKKYVCAGVRAYQKDARSVARTCVERFDRILLDAPCSAYSHFGEGFAEKNKKEIKATAKLQKQLLHAALVALKPGGTLVYSTCTFFEEENEEVVQNALNSQFDVSVERLEFFDTLANLSLPFGAASVEAKFFHSPFGVFIAPNEIFDAFFVTKLVKRG